MTNNLGIALHIEDVAGDSEELRHLRNRNYLLTGFGGLPYVASMRRTCRVVAVLALVWSSVGAAQSIGLVRVPYAAASTGPVSYGAGGLQSLPPARLLDTRTGVGAPMGKVAAGSTTVLDVTGVGGVPASGVGAVVLNVTVVAPTAGSGFVTVFPTGGERPLVSNLNFTVGRTVPNLVIVKVGQSGSVSLFNSAGDAHLLADVAGWFPEGTGLEPLAPSRLLDTRTGVGAPVGKVAAGSTTVLDVTGVGGVPASGVGAVVLNVTVVAPSAGSGFVTVFPTGGERPLVSNLNFTVGRTVPNLVVVKVGGDGTVSLFNSAGDTHLLADVAGWFPEGGEFQSLPPARLLDTRTGVGAPVGKVAAGSTTVLDVTGVGGVPASGVGAVVLNVTVVAPSAGSGFVTVFPTGGERPLVSNLNFTVGRTVPNLVVVKVGGDGTVSLFNSAGDTHLLADVAGWFPENTSTSTSYDLKAGAVVVGPGDVVSVDPLGTGVVLSGSADVPQVNGFLLMAPGAGGGQPIAGHVTEVVEHPDGSASVTLAPANLQDMFNDLEVHEHGVVPILPIERTAARGRRTEGFKPECSSSGEVVAGPELSFSGGSVDFDFSLSGRHAALQASLTVTLTWAVSVTGSFTCTLDTPDVPLFVAGPVLFEGEVEGSITVTGEMAGSVSVDVPITVGFVYDHGQLTNTSDLNADGSAEIDTPTVTATLDVGAKIEAKLFGVGGLGLTSGPVVQIQATLDCVVVTAWAKFVASAEIGRWGLDWEFDLGTIETSPIELYHTPSCQPHMWTGTIREQGHLSMPGANRTDVFDSDITATLRPPAAEPDAVGNGSYSVLLTGSKVSQVIDNNSLADGCVSGGFVFPTLTYTATYSGQERADRVVFGQSSWTVQFLPSRLDPENTGDAGSGSGSAAGGCAEWGYMRGADQILQYSVVLPVWGSGNEATLPDEDPDPLHLVGTLTHVESSWYTATYTYTYDLWLVPYVAP